MRHSIIDSARRRIGGWHVKIEDHLTKAERIEGSLAHCTKGDYETVIEGAMLAGTHWFNILLHRALLMPIEQDAMHAEFLSIGERRKARLLVSDALDALDTIEHFRTTHVRGDMPDGEQAALRALECLAQIRNEAEKLRPVPVASELARRN